MNRIGIAKFEKVSFSQWKKDMLSDDNYEMYSKFPESELKKIYDKIELPKRSTSGSAGYDIHFPLPIVDIPAGSSIGIPTGIRCKMENGWVGLIYPRSSLGIKNGLTILNTIPVIDEDYAYSDNEGHILLFVKNNGNKTLEMTQGLRIVQMVFTPYGTTINDDVTAKRNGGVGSTGK